MIPLREPADYSVTSKSRLLNRPWLFNILLDCIESDDLDPASERGELTNRMASISNTSVREMLAVAQAGGMSQLDFERQAGVLRPNEASPRREQCGRLGEARTMRGRLWHHYMKTSTARMSCLTFLEYLAAFSGRGWMDIERAKRYALQALSVLIDTKSRGSRLAAQEQFTREFLLRKFPHVSARVVGAFLKNVRRAHGDDEDYLAWLQDFPSHVRGMESLGTFLSHQALKNSDA